MHDVNEKKKEKDPLYATNPRPEFPSVPENMYTNGNPLQPLLKVGDQRSPVPFVIPVPQVNNPCHAHAMQRSSLVLVFAL